MVRSSLTIGSLVILFSRLIRFSHAAAQGCTNNSQCQKFGNDWICSNVDNFCVRGCSSHGCASGGTCSSNGLCYWGNAPNGIVSDIRTHLGLVIVVIVAIVVVIVTAIIWRVKANKKGKTRAFTMPFGARMPFNRGQGQQKEGEWHPLVDSAGSAGGHATTWLSASPTQQEYAVPPLQSPGMAGDLGENHLNTRTSIDYPSHEDGSSHPHYGHGGI